MHRGESNQFFIFSHIKRREKLELVVIAKNKTAEEETEEDRERNRILLLQGGVGGDECGGVSIDVCRLQVAGLSRKFSSNRKILPDFWPFSLVVLA